MRESSTRSSIRERWSRIWRCNVACRYGRSHGPRDNELQVAIKPAISTPGSKTAQSPRLLRSPQGLLAAALAEAKAFTAFKAVSERSDGVIPAEYRELIALVSL